MKVMVASKMCEPADTLKEETEFDSNMTETKPKTSYKRQMITYYTILILSLTVIGGSYQVAFLLWGNLVFVFMTWTLFKLL